MESEGKGCQSGYLTSSWRWWVTSRISIFGKARWERTWSWETVKRESLLISLRCLSQNSLNLVMGFPSWARTAEPEAHMEVCRFILPPQYFSGAKRQATLPFKPLKKMKKRNPWSDSGSDSDSDFEALPQRERVVRKAAGEWSPKSRRGAVCGGKNRRGYLESSQSLRSRSEIIFKRLIYFYCI